MQWVSGEKSCQNLVVHPKFSPDISHSQGLPPPPPGHREVWILVDLDAALKVGRSPYPPSPPPPPPDIGNLGFRQIWTQHQKLEVHPTPPPPPIPSPDIGNLGFLLVFLGSGER